MAVDETNGDIYVANLDGEEGHSEISRCTESGAEAPFSAGPGAGTNHLGGFNFPVAQGASQIAVSPTNQDFYVVDRENHAVKAFAQTGALATFSAGPGSGTNELVKESFGFLCGVATDQNGDIYIAEATGGPNFTGLVQVFRPDGAEVTSFETAKPCSLAVDSNGALYVLHEGTRSVEKFTPSSFPVTPATTYGGVAADAGPAYSIAIDPSNNDLYVDERPAAHHSEITQLGEHGNTIGHFPSLGESGELGDSEGIAVNGSTGFVYASDEETHKGVTVFAPAPPLPPSIGASEVSTVGPTSATVSTEVNPHHFATRFWYQFMTATEYQQSGGAFAGARQTAVGSLGQAGIPQDARAQLTGLLPGTTYVFRVAAENAAKEGAPKFGNVISGEEGEFHTYVAPSGALPDQRAYELVSPASKSGEVFPAEIDLGGSCERRGAPSIQCYPGLLSHLMPMQVSPNGERVSFVGSPFSPGVSPAANEYLGSRTGVGWATESLSGPLFVNGNGNQGYVGLSSDLSRAVLYQVSPTLTPTAPSSGGQGYANLYLRTAAGGLQPLITSPPPHRRAGPFCAVPFCEELYEAFGGGNAGTASVPAYTHLIFEANDSLTSQVAGVAPAAPEVGPFESDLYEWSGDQLHLVNVLPGNGGALAGAVLGSGSLLRAGKSESREALNYDHAISDDGSRIFWSRESDGHVFVRIDGDETREVPDTGKFLTAAANGSKVLLNDGCLYDVDAGGPDCQADLSQVSQGHSASGFKGILGTSEDLSRVYFVDTEALTSVNPENANHESAVVGQFNLYLWNEGSTTFIGRLTEADNAVTLGGKYGDWKAAAADRLAQVSADGDYAAFMSKAPLTGYDNRFRGGGNCPPVRDSTSCFEVFEYDASSNHLVCASCNPTGLKPLGPSNLTLVTGGEEELGFPLEIRPTPFVQPTNLSDTGRLFFESQDTLSPQDTNGRTTDVYEWEPASVGSCAEPEGCLELISNGHDASDSFFLNATASGDDVFIVTRAQLVPSDKNQQLDLYDARVNGGFREGDSAPCQGEACKGSIEPQPSGRTPGSAAVSGPGNAKQSTQCKKHFIKRHGKCVKKSKKKGNGHPKKRGSAKQRADRTNGGAK